MVEGLFSAAQGRGAKLIAADVQNVESDFMTLAALAQQVFHRDDAVLEEHLAGGGAVNAHLVLFGSQRQAGRSLLHDKGREVLAVNLGEHREHVGEARVGDPHFLAVQDPRLAVFAEGGCGLGAKRIGTRAGFGEAVRGRERAAGQAWQVLALLLLRTVVQDGQRADAHMGDQRGGKGAGAPDLLGNDAANGHVLLHAVVFGGDGRAQQAEFAGLLQQAYAEAVVGFLLFDGRGVREDFLFHEFTCHVLDHELLFAEIF